MMSLLLERAESVEKELKEALLKRPRLWSAVHGASLELDEFWAHSIARKLLKSGASNGLDPEESLANALWELLENPIKLPKRVSGGSETAAAADKPPIRISVWLKHGVSGESLPQEIGSLPVVYERRAPIKSASLFSSIAARWRDVTGNELSVGAAEPVPTAGTIGGYLRSSDGSLLMASCGHVLGTEGSVVYAPGPFEGKRSDACAMVRWSREPEPNSFNQPLGTMVPADPVDFAVAEVFPAFEQRLARRSRAHVVRPSAKMINLQPVFFLGKVSGFVEAVVSPSLVMWAQLEYPDRTWRYVGRLFEIIPSANALYPIARPGDSGAWICDRAGDLICWNGVIVGVQGHRAYCAFAEYSKSAIDSTIGPTNLA
jgi:hypothetical protein